LIIFPAFRYNCVSLAFPILTLAYMLKTYVAIDGLEYCSNTSRTSEAETF